MMNAVLFFLAIIVTISLADSIEAHIKRRKMKNMDIKFSEEQNQKYLKDIKQQAKDIENLLSPVREIILTIETKIEISEIDLEKKTHLLIYLGKVFNKLSEIEKLGKKGIDNG